MINQTFEHLRDYVVSIELIPTCLVYIFKRLVHAMYSTPLLISCLHTLWGYQRHAFVIDLSAVGGTLWGFQFLIPFCVYFVFSHCFLILWRIITTVKGQEHLSLFLSSLLPRGKMPFRISLVFLFFIWIYMDFRRCYVYF